VFVIFVFQQKVVVEQENEEDEGIEFCIHSSNVTKVRFI